MKLSKNLWALSLSGLIYISNAFLCGASAIEFSSLELATEQTNVYKILPITYQEKSDAYDEEQSWYRSQVAYKLIALFNKEDLFLCPGRSCIHFSNILKSCGYSVFAPSFSKGHNVLSAIRGSEYDDKDKKDAKQIELQERIGALSKDDLKSHEILGNVLKEFEDLPIYIDFNTHEIKSTEDFVLSRSQIEGYREYLSEKCNISPNRIKQARGDIIFFDSVCSGGGIGGFLKVILDWCAEEHLDISDRIKVVNFNYKIRETPVFESNNPLAAYWRSMIYVIVPESVWRKFSYNRIQTLDKKHFFFPPWTWDQKQLWRDPLTRLALDGTSPVVTAASLTHLALGETKPVVTIDSLKHLALGGTKPVVTTGPLTRSPDGTSPVVTADS